MKKPYVFAVSGVKNSGKTTFAARFIEELVQRGFKVAAIKHDAHDFDADVEGTDSFKLRRAGAYGTAVFSENKFMVVKEVKDISEKELMDMFPEADFVLLEGFKYSAYPKFEVVRKGVSEEPVCSLETVIALITDLPFSGVDFSDMQTFLPHEIKEAANYFLDYVDVRQADGGR